jgi:hypothetical protein
MIAQHWQIYNDHPKGKGGLNRSPQHFILEGKDGVWDSRESAYS